MNLTIMSVSKGVDEDVDNKNSRLFADALADAGIDYHVCLGAWQGTQEMSFLIFGRSDHPLLCKWAHETHQESIVAVDREKNAWFHDVETREESFGGTWTQIAPEDKNKFEGWTHDYHTGKVWTII